MSYTNPYPHLKISENIIEAIKSAHTDEWKAFFKSLRESRLPTLEACLDSDLTKERGKLTMISELESIVLTIQKQQKQKPKQ